MFLCHKHEGAVDKLISSPSDYPRAFICEECVAICHSILSEDPEELDAKAEPTLDALGVEPEGDANPIRVDANGNLYLKHPRAAELIAAMSTWVAREAQGLDASKELAEVRRLATLVLRHEPGMP